MAESKFKKAFFSIYSYTIIYSLFGVLSLSYHACFNSSLSTLEKRYHFSSTTGGYIMITDNIATVLTNLFIGYYGKTAHKPRWMSVGCIVTGLSILFTALPYFIYGPAQESDLDPTIVAKALGAASTISNRTDNDQMCQAVQIESTSCGASDMSATSTMTAVAVFCFGASNFFRGFGTSIYFTYGTPYLDDNVSKAKMPTFFAFIFAARILGAPIGYYMSSVALKIYENPFARPDGLSDTDPRWIGAWWIGFLISGSLILLLSIPLALFPREFKKKQPTKELDDSNAEQNGTEQGGDQIQESAVDIKKPLKPSDQSLRELPGEIYAILTNPIVLCQLMGNLFRGIGLIGYFVFQPKYLEAQFRQSASKASLVSGTTGFMAKIFGVLLGGGVITMLRPGPKTLTSYIFLVEATSVVALLYASTIMGPHYAYPLAPLNEHTGQLELSNSCNRGCHCEEARYQPVCETSEMKAYFSPCHAGCKSSFKEPDGSVSFTSCECTENPSHGGLVKCPPDTDGLYRYATIVAIGAMVSGSSRPGNMVTFFRSIQPEQKSLAVAVGSFWHSLFVAIPYPILFGKIFDYCCLVWASECNKRGNCWLYDTTKLRHVYHNIALALVFLGSVFDFIMIFLSGRLQNLYDEEEESLASKLGSKITSWKAKRFGGARRESGAGNGRAGNKEENPKGEPQLQLETIQQTSL